LWETVTAAIAAVAVTLLASWRYWRKFKTKLNRVTTFMVALEQALYDDKITEEEFRDLFEKFKKIIEDP